MSKDIRKSVTSGFMWSFGERILAQSVSFIVSIVLARILMPEECGVLSFLLVFINIANVFVSNGFGEALIQKKNSDEKDFSTIFWCSHLFSWVLYIIIFLLAPFISKVYNNELYTPVLRVISLKLPLASINTIQHAHVSKHLEFRKFFFSTLTGTIISGVAGILAAIAGWGVWALVLQYLLNSTIDTVFLLLTVKWKPRLIFSLASFKELMSFGFKMMMSALINTTYIEMQSLVIGARYTASDLAFYKRGNQFPSLFITNICTAVGKVLFPTMSNVQDKNSIKNMTRRSMQITAYLISPLMFGLIAVSTPLVKVLLTDKWLPCVPFLQIACIQFLFQPLQAANCQAIKAMGKGGMYLKMEIAKKIVGIVLLIAAIPHGAFAIAIACAISIVISTIISMIPNASLLEYSYKDQVSDISSSLIMSIIMLISIYPITYLKLNSIVVLVVQVITGVAIYFSLSKLFQVQPYLYLMGFVKKMVVRRRSNNED